jgi:hypothetical protein
MIIGQRRSRAAQHKAWGPKRPRKLSRAAVHAIDRAYERKTRQEGKRACRLEPK